MDPTIENPPSRKVLIAVDGEEKVLDYSSFLESLNVRGLVRIPEQEFKNIDLNKGNFAHFNLEKTDHKIGERYVLLKIIRNGSYASEKKSEQPPLLSMEGAVLVECIEAKNHLSYDDLTLEHFEYSMNNIKDKQSLQGAIQSRYGVTRKDFSPSVIVEKGIGFTLFRIIP